MTLSNTVKCNETCATYDIIIENIDNLLQLQLLLPFNSIKFKVHSWIDRNYVRIAPNNVDTAKSIQNVIASSIFIQTILKHHFFISPNDLLLAEISLHCHLTLSNPTLNESTLLFLIWLQLELDIYVNIDINPELAPNELHLYSSTVDDKTIFQSSNHPNQANDKDRRSRINHLDHKLPRTATENGSTCLFQRCKIYLKNDNSTIAHKLPAERIAPFVRDVLSTINPIITRVALEYLCEPYFEYIQWWIAIHYSCFIVRNSVEKKQVAIYGSIANILIVRDILRTYGSHDIYNIQHVMSYYNCNHHHITIYNIINTLDYRDNFLERYHKSAILKDESSEILSKRANYLDTTLMEYGGMEALIPTTNNNNNPLFNKEESSSQYRDKTVESTSDDCGVVSMLQHTAQCQLMPLSNVMEAASIYDHVSRKEEGDLHVPFYCKSNSELQMRDSGYSSLMKNTITPSNPYDFDQHSKEDSYKRITPKDRRSDYTIENDCMTKPEFHTDVNPVQLEFDVMQREETDSERRNFDHLHHINTSGTKIMTQEVNGKKEMYDEYQENVDRIYNNNIGMDAPIQKKNAPSPFFPFIELYNLEGKNSIESTDNFKNLLLEETFADTYQTSYIEKNVNDIQGVGQDEAVVAQEGKYITAVNDRDIYEKADMTMEISQKGYGAKTGKNEFKSVSTKNPFEALSRENDDVNVELSKHSENTLQENNETLQEVINRDSMNGTFALQEKGFHKRIVIVDGSNVALYRDQKIFNCYDIVNCIKALECYFDEILVTIMEKRVFNDTTPEMQSDNIKVVGQDVLRDLMFKNQLLIVRVIITVFHIYKLEIMQISGKRVKLMSSMVTKGHGLDDLNQAKVSTKGQNPIAYETSYEDTILLKSAMKMNAYIISNDKFGDCTTKQKVYSSTNRIPFNIGHDFTFDFSCVCDKGRIENH